MMPKLTPNFAFEPLEPNTVIFTGAHADRFEEAEFARHGLKAGTAYHVTAINGRQIFLTGIRGGLPTASFCSRAQWSTFHSAN